MGGQVLQECMSSGWHILQDNVLQEDMLYKKTGLIGGYVF